MRIYYHLSEYISHRVAGKSYIACLESLGHTVDTDEGGIAHTDLAVLHDDPLNYPLLFERLPELKKRPCVSYCVWENEKLTPYYIPHLQGIAKIWTPSDFSRRSMAAHFPGVRVLPHVVERLTPGKEDKVFAEGFMQGCGSGFRFFSVLDAINPRKNVRALLAAFSALRSLMVRKPLLFIKLYRVDFDYSSIPGVCCTTGDLTDGQMAALHMLSDAYVSPHHAEGWGLSLSTAMAYGKPVIATAYSGNMEYMDAGNSFPVPYALGPVSEEMCTRLPLFSPDMRWAEIDQEALVQTMHRVARGDVPPELSRNAARITRRFGPAQAAERMRELLAELEGL